MGLKIVEIPIHYGSCTARDGKVSLRDAFRTAWTLRRRWLPAPEQYKPKESVSMDQRQQVARPGNVAAHVAIACNESDRVVAKR